MKQLLIRCMFLFALGACGPMDEAEDDAPDIDSKEDALWCFGMPYSIMAFPNDSGSWRGSGAGQIMYPIFGNTGPTCPPIGYELDYFQDDGAINLVMGAGWSYNTCSKIANDKVACNGQVFQCPANACLTLPATWRLNQAAPGNEIVWGWSNANYSAAPGNHGIWPKYGQTCANSAPSIQFNPSGTGGVTLNCSYPMGAFTLRQF